MRCERVMEKLTKDRIDELESFLVLVNGEDYRNLANTYISCMFSNDFRKPTFVIALSDSQIVGAAAFSEELFTVNVWGISWVSVHPDYREKGIGQSLVEKCIDEIKKKAKSPVTCILATYPEKTKLYEKIGFTTSSYDAEGGAIMTLPLTY
jgi:ribosomal protein S18 acetylase RimI-like enzyme